MAAVGRMRVVGESVEPNYKQLYLESKKNVSLFMKQVDQELSSILATHQQEKQQLRLEIDRLRSQLAQQSDANSQAGRTKRTNSTNTQSSVSRETVEECLAKFSHFDKKTLPSDKDRSEPNSFIEERRSKLHKQQEKEKENKILPENINKDMGGSHFKSTQNPKWERKTKERKVLESADKAENVKDFLKDIREKLKGEKSGVRRESEEPVISVITPGFFTVRNSER